MDLSFILTLIYSFLLAAGFALVLVPPLRFILARCMMVDIPNDRRINKKPVVVGGGIAVFAAFWLTLVILRGTLGAAAFGVLDAEWTKVFFIASSFLLIVGVLDDAFDIPPLLKLAAQILVASFLYYKGIQLSDVLIFSLPPIFNYFLTVGWFVIIINAFNLIDGLDGLSSGLALIAAIGLAVCLIGRSTRLSGEAFVVLAFGGACLGFLRYNFNPASIFIGDCGSMFLGLFLATLPLCAGTRGAFLSSIGVPLLILGVPLLDTILAIWRRSVRRILGGNLARAVMSADKEHTHHRLLARGLTQKNVAISLYAIAIFLVVIAISLSFFADLSEGILMLSFLVFAAIMANLLSRNELWDTGKALLDIANSPRISRMIAPIHAFLDIIILIAAWWWSFGLAHISDAPYRTLTRFPVFLFAFLLATALSGGLRFHRRWCSVCIADVIKYVAFLTMAWIGACGIIILYGAIYRGFYRQATIFLFLAIPFLLLSRTMHLLLKELMPFLKSLRLRDSKNDQRILAYGGGHVFELFRKTLAEHFGNENRVLIGIIDNDPLLKKTIIRGKKVLGNDDEIETLIKEEKIYEIVITARISAEKEAFLASIARRAGIRLSKFSAAETLLVGDTETEREKGYYAG